jgi:hypothetical protein
MRHQATNAYLLHPCHHSESTARTVFQDERAEILAIGFASSEQRAATTELQRIRMAREKALGLA